MKTPIENKSHIALLCYVALLLLCFVSPVSQAHPMHRSLVETKVVDGHWALRLKLPNDRLAIALKQKPTKAQLSDYILKHINAKSTQGTGLAWKKEITQVLKSLDRSHWQVEMKLSPPEGERLYSVDIDYQVITETIITHKVDFWLMPDDSNEATAEKPRNLGYLRGTRTRISIKWPRL